QEWPSVSGRGPVSNGVNVIWYIWVVLLPVLYFQAGRSTAADIDKLDEIFGSGFTLSRP
ncbi:hypothetical protein MPER_15228, partial [Moniliophthora perniciosa FA553]